MTSSTLKRHKIKVVWKTSDGKEWDSEEAAEAHEYGKEYEDNARAFLQHPKGKKLIQQCEELGYEPNSHIYALVREGDRSADGRGGATNSIGYFHGTLKDIIVAAFASKRFVGAYDTYGEVKIFKPIKVSKTTREVSNYRHGV